MAVKKWDIRIKYDEILESHTVSFNGKAPVMKGRDADKLLIKVAKYVKGQS